MSFSEEPRRSPYPVLVFVHGESFSWGSGNLYDGRVLATYANSVVVTFNFRLGIFGEFRNSLSLDRWLAEIKNLKSYQNHFYLNVEFHVQ